MLLYDTNNRFLGNNTGTNPNFNAFDANISNAESVSKRMRQIADIIPNYKWNMNAQRESGATPNDILIGLRNLGYTKTELEPFNIDVLYNNMKYKGIGYGGTETEFTRGILLGGYAGNGGGHIWFCDGYYEQSYTVTRKFLGIKVKRWTEYEDKLYMNWGWGANGGNGWYTAGSHYHNNQLMMYTNLNYYENPNSNVLEELREKSKKNYYEK